MSGCTHAQQISQAHAPHHCGSQLRATKASGLLTTYGPISVLLQLHVIELTDLNAR